MLSGLMELSLTVTHRIARIVLLTHRYQSVLLTYCHASYYTLSDHVCTDRVYCSLTVTHRYHVMLSRDDGIT